MANDSTADHTPDSTTLLTSDFLLLQRKASAFDFLERETAEVRWSIEEEGLFCHLTLRRQREPISSIIGWIGRSLLSVLEGAQERAGD